MKPLLCLTMGDINGIGPEILLQALRRPETCSLCRPIVIGSPGVLTSLEGYADAGLRVESVNSVAEAQQDEGVVAVWDAGVRAPARRPGVLDPEAGRCAMEWVKAAVRLAQDHVAQGIVTCPINKECVHKAGYPYAGHTDLIASMTHSEHYRMCLFAGDMRVVHVTAHMAMRDAIEALTPDRIARSIQVGHEALVRLGLPSPRIAVAGLNPHAGENGAFGDEEIRIIRPAIEACAAQGIHCSGPHPPDAVFRHMREGKYDLTVAMYHDQGHVPMKLIAMDSGVNVTLGIPIIRTSPDHGTAFDIAGKGLAREDSLCAAIDLAARMARTPQAPESPMS